jgi:hypothetical protein
MKMWKWLELVFFSILSTLSSCSLIREPESIHVQLAYKLLFSFSKEVKQTDNLFLFGEGGSMMGDIQSFELYFDSPLIPNIEQARELMIRCIDKFYNLLEQMPEIHPYLHEDPFPIKNFNISIHFIYSAQCTSPSAIDRVSLVKGRICFSEYDQTKKDSITILRESYEEALQKLTNDSET